MTKDELNKYLQPYQTAYNRNDYLAQYKNNRIGQLALFGQKDNLDAAVYDEYNKAFQAGKTDALFGMGMSALNGVEDLWAQGKKNASINTMPGYYNALQDYSRTGTGQYSNYGQLINEQASASTLPMPELEEMRGMTNNQKVGAVASSTMSGLTAGSAFGPYGMAIGAGIGLLSGVGSVMRGDENAAAEMTHADMARKLAGAEAYENSYAAKAALDEKNNRRGVLNSKAEGGQIKKQLSVKEFADAILKNKKRNEATRSAGIVRTHCDGGTMIRIKVK